MEKRGSKRDGGAGAVVYQEFDEQWLSLELARAERYELVYFEGGAGSWQLGRVTGVFGVGTLLLLPPGALRLWRLEEGGEGGRAARGIVVGFAARALPEGLLRLPEMEGLRRLREEALGGLSFDVPDRDRLRARLRTIDRTVGALRLARLYVALEMVAGYKRRQLSEEKALARRGPALAAARFEATKRFVAERFLGPVTRVDAARQAGMDEAAFSRFFRAASGATFADYVASLRVRHAAVLLGSRRDLSVPEVARSSGYDNVSAFHRQFKKRLGTTPQAYRAAANAEPMAP